MSSQPNSASKGSVSHHRSRGAICWLLRVLLWSLGLAVFIFAVFSPFLKDSEGALKGEFAFALSVSAGLIVLGWGICGRLRTFTFWFAAALIGQAAALQAIRAGKLIHYQHYLQPGMLAAAIPWAFIIIAIQAILVGLGIARRRSQIWRWLISSFQYWQLVVICLVVLISSAALSPSIGIYLTELVFATFLILLNLANLVLAVGVLPDDALAKIRGFIEKVFDCAGPGGNETAAGLDRTALLGALWVMIISALLSVFVYERHPHVPDEVLYLFQARYMAQGKLTVPAAPVPGAFSFYLLPYRSDQWYSIFPPGWPALLALGVKIGFPWLVNPILAGVNILLSYELVRQLYTRRIARWTVFLLCVSPWYIFMGMNFMSHTLALSLALASAVTLIHAKEKASLWYALLSGAIVGALSLVRPYDGLIVGFLLILWALGALGKKMNYASFSIFVAGIVLISILVLPYNYGVGGSALKFPLQSYYAEYYGPKANALGFGHERGLGWLLDAFPGHTPLEALLNAVLNLFSVNIELFGWSVGSILLVTIFLVSGDYRSSDWLMIAVIACVIGFYSLYWFSGGPDFGARYWYLIIVPLVVLSVRGLEIIVSKLELYGLDNLYSMTRVFSAILAASIFAIINYFPWRAVDKYYHYLNMRPDVLALDEEHEFGESILLVQGSAHPDYASAWTYNPLDYSAPVPIYAWDENPETTALVLSSFADRSVWILQGPSLTGKGYEVVEGPISPQEALGDE